MKCLHYRAAHWCQQGIFDNLQSFAEFETRVNRVIAEKDRGDIFEIFVESFLATQSITQRVHHWVSGQIPLELRERYKLPKDGTGIDGIYERHDGTHIAYQVKYRQKSHLTFAEVSPFLGITEAFADRVIFTNAASLSNVALVRTRWYSREMFHHLSAGALKQIECWLKEKPIPTVRATPDPKYQLQALSDIAAALAHNDRATAVMACGTGKTFISLWAAEQADPHRVLVLVPSLTLLQQTLREWSEHTSWGSRFSYLCVCSDQTVDLRNDEIRIEKGDCDFRVDTDPAVVRRFLTKSSHDVKVVFSTYHSSPVVGAGAKGAPPFDFAVFDEAHKTTGRTGRSFSYALSDNNIAIRKRLFVTATPRHIDIRHRDQEGEFLVQSMDDPAVYGHRAHVLSFHSAAKKEIICRYKVLISVIDKQMVDDFTRNNGITLIDGDEIAARWIANLIALEQAVKKVDARKIISFHSRVATAKKFASSEPCGIARYLPEHDVRHVNGKQNSADRNEIIQAFARAERALLTNARCLTEGVNIPAVDMVAFIDPRQSRIDIAQAVGRVMRKPHGPTLKTVGYVLVPLFCGTDGETVEDAIKSSRFDAVASVVNALQENDEELVDMVRTLKQQKGEGRTFNPRPFMDTIDVIAPRVDYAQLTRSIAIQIVDRIGASWDEAYGRLLKYRQCEGDCLVPGLFKAADGFSLGKWVATQRAMKGQLPAERRNRLDELDFVWGQKAQLWREGLEELRRYKQREGNCQVPRAYKTEDGFGLGRWVGNQLQYESKLSHERRQQLAEMGFCFDVPKQHRGDGLKELRAYKEREGHCRVPQDYKTADGYGLGVWVGHQRANPGLSSPERRKQLEELGLWTTIDQSQVKNVDDQKWERGLSELRNYKALEGHCRVPFAFGTKDGYPLGVWVTRQRQQKEHMSTSRSQKLNELSFVWDPAELEWENGICELQAYKLREGDCRVPVRFKTEGGYSLGTWVSRQRLNKNRLSAERHQQLDTLGFSWTRHSLDQRWNKGLKELQKYKEREGHCQVPQYFKTSDGFKLGLWVHSRRTRKANLSKEHRQLLNDLGFVWKPNKGRVVH